MLFSLNAVLGSWCFGDRRDDDIPTVKAFKKSRAFIYVYIATWCWQNHLKSVRFSFGVLISVGMSNFCAVPLI